MQKKTILENVAAPVKSLESVKEILGSLYNQEKKEKLMSPTGGNEADASVTEGLSNGVKNGASKTSPNAPATPKTTPDYAASLGEFLNISL